MNMKQMDDKRWAAVKNRDSSVPAAFFYAVKTTGIYCRPGCSSRLPNQKNVEFFSTPGGAEDAGYRPCKRCRPESSPIIDDQIELLYVNVRRTHHFVHKKQPAGGFYGKAIPGAGSQTIDAGRVYNSSLKGRLQLTQF